MRVLELVIAAFVIVASGAFAVGQDRSRNEPESKPTCEVILRVQFLNSGTVGEIERSSTTCEGEEWSYPEFYWGTSERAARVIKFTPPTKDGETRTVVKEVKYTFTLVDEGKDEKKAKEDLPAVSEIVSMSDPDRALVILHKPRAPYPKSETGTICATGQVILRITFRADGRIGDVMVVKGMPYGITESAIEAAKRIAFIPPERKGHAYTTNKSIQFTFSIY